ncbi:MAG: S16 family serine protease [Actinomycetota bacterium]
MEKKIVYPRDVIYPDDQTPKQIDAVNSAEMVDSQEAAKYAALSYLGYSIPSKVVIVKDSSKNERMVRKYSYPFKISINLEGTGGPSGGLIFAIGIVEKLSPQDFMRGRKVAGTGTIDTSGIVGAIGSIDEKMIAAKKAGASIFLAPADNCKDIGHIPSGLKVYIVENLSDAISALKNPKKWCGISTSLWLAAGNCRKKFTDCTWQGIR